MSACLTPKLSKIQEHREGLEPSSPHYGCGVFAAGSPVHVLKSGRWDSNPRSRVPKTRGLAAALHPDCQSERSDLNRRSPGPRPGAIITRLHHVLFSTPYGNRTRVCGLKARYPEPLDERGALLSCAYIERIVGWVALESTSPALQTSAIPSQLPAQQKTRCHL